MMNMLINLYCDRILSMFNVIKYSFKISIFLTLVSVYFCAWSFASQTLKVWELDTYIKILTDTIDKTNDWKKEKDKLAYVMIQRICNNLSDNNFNSGKVQFVSSYNAWNSTEWVVKYDAESSVFVTILCNSFLSKDDEKDNKNKVFALNTIIKTPTIRSLWLACKKIDNTSISPSSADCAERTRSNNTDYSYIFYNLIKLTLNDVFNLAMARTYGVNNANASESDIANAYFVNTFNTLGLRPEQKTYPKAYNTLKNYIKLWKNMQKSTAIINVWSTEKLPSELCIRELFLYYQSDIKCDTDTTHTLPDYQVIATDILYNELFFYALFDQIYNNYLPYYWEEKSDLPLVFQQQTITSALQSQQQRSQAQEKSIVQSLQQSMRQLNNTIAFYPVHIGMLMYQEDLINLRDNLSKIYLPLHQLHYKLQNVQSAS